jgi:hypothetical protein
MARGTKRKWRDEKGRTEMKRKRERKGNDLYSSKI